MLATAKLNIAFRLDSTCDSDSVVDIDGRKPVHSSDHRWGSEKRENLQ